MTVRLLIERKKNMRPAQQRNLMRAVAILQQFVTQAEHETLDSEMEMKNIPQAANAVSILERYIEKQVLADLRKEKESR